MKTSFALYCKDKQIGKGEWFFRSREGGMEVLDPDDRVVCRFGHGEAEARFALPSFWRSVKHITFTTDAGAVLLFEPDPKDVRAVRAYLDAALMEGGIERLGGLRRRPWGSLVGGLALLAGSVAAAYAIKEVLDLPPRDANSYARPFMVGMIVGVALFAWGVYTVFRAGRLIRRWRKGSG